MENHLIREMQNELLHLLYQKESWLKEITRCRTNFRLVRRSAREYSRLLKKARSLMGSSYPTHHDRRVP